MNSRLNERLMALEARVPVSPYEILSKAERDGRVAEALRQMSDRQLEAVALGVEVTALPDVPISDAMLQAIAEPNRVAAIRAAMRADS